MLSSENKGTGKGQGELFSLGKGKFTEGGAEGSSCTKIKIKIKKGGRTIKISIFGINFPLDLTFNLTSPVLLLPIVPG